jgi:hypothetical protein
MERPRSSRRKGRLSLLFSVVPALIGMQLGGMLRKGLDEDLFRRLLLISLVVTGLNLLRRGLM